MTFKVGDEVSWSSSANGSTKKKIVHIVDVIPAGVSVYRSKFINSLDVGNIPRKHESYVVCVGVAPGSRAKPKYYWPRVSALSLHKDK